MSWTYKEVHDEEYKGFDITIYTHEDDTCTADIKKLCGEPVWGWHFLSSFKHARDKAAWMIDKGVL